MKDLPKFAKNGVEGLHGMNEEQNIESLQQSRFVLCLYFLKKLIIVFFLYTFDLVFIRQAISMKKKTLHFNQYSYTDL